jgi:putative membrane protein
MEISDLPAVNATLNGLAGAFLVAGYVLIKRGEVALHKRCMLAALAVSTLFLISYVTYHAFAGSRPFPGQGSTRLVYFAILISHIVLAAVIVPMAHVTARHGLFYLMLYQLY